MIVKKIVGFGDSWMYGDELLDPVLAAADPKAHFSWVQNTAYRETHCFLGRLGQHYRLATENFGIPGGSLQSTIWTYLSWLQHEPEPDKCLALIFLTDSSRESFYNPNRAHQSHEPRWNQFVHSAWVFTTSVVGSEYRDMIKRYMVLTECSDLCQYRYNQAVLFFDGQRARAGIPTLMFNTMPSPMVLTGVSSLIWPDFAWTRWFHNHPENQQRQLVMPDNHPNEKGHAMICNMLIPEVDRVIIAE